ncbi:DUF5946 family protein [Paenibacillus sp. FSL M7-1455]|jgi:hypothetical protein|uniref:Uncharacterized protein n=1 Tax=Paenibacillus cookii TaxID=157839 RepID=A0ABQ4LTD4_9BACL|nr:DUF5946 family protein [Paenibacillus cookii]KHF34244.1 hypothetical protein CM49_03575 [Paenibacillus sp. P1XP2]GIO66536.1 hypothetical protein J21TS3_13570 [Paenibacillus cookii]
MVDIDTVMENGKCMECGAAETDGLSCFEMFHYPLAWEHRDPEMYALHFWLVSCYMIQHPSNYTEEGYKLLAELFTDAYDHRWSTERILEKNRELVSKAGKITNPLPSRQRKRTSRSWSMTIEDLYRGGEENAIRGILKWRDAVRKDIQN